MFVRKVKNRSGSASVQIISKRYGKYQVVETVGVSKDPDEIERLVIEGKNRIKYHVNQLRLFPILSETDLSIQNFVKNTSNLQVRTIGPELIFGALFDRIGFNIIENELFRHIVIARMAYPTSKLKTVDYLYRYRGINIKVDTIYRFLDKLNEKYKETVEQVTFKNTKKILKNISVVFYDMTTLYFETEDEDDLRKIGFSKDGKFQCPQIMIGLLVGENGYPIGYDIFKGNTFEGGTLMPILGKIQSKYDFDNPIVVADAGLLSKSNIKSLVQEEYEFILGARIKNETNKIKRKILKKAEAEKAKTKSRTIKDGYSFFIRKPDNTKLIITYSDKRKRKDAYNRKKGLKKLRAKVKSGKLTKESINNRGYNKFLSLKSAVDIEINEDKIREDEKWDGLKGYITNASISSKKVIDNYKQLWQIEKAFRISKTDLRIRPIYHYRQKRIEAHICISFVAYTIYKELERLLEKHRVGFSSKRSAELTHNMYELEYTLPQSQKTEKTILKMDSEQQTLYDVIWNN